MKKILIAISIVFVSVFAATATAAVFHPSILGDPFDTYAGSDDGTELFSLKDVDGFQDDAAAFLYLESAGFASVNTFGIYEAGNASNKLEVFAGTNSPSPFGKTIQWTSGTNVQVVGGGSTSGIDRNSFGFYISTTGEGPLNTYYSEAGLNADSFDHFLTFYVAGLGGVDYVLAMEDLFGGGDQDFNDMVVGVHDVTAVPPRCCLAVRLCSDGLDGRSITP